MTWNYRVLKHVTETEEFYQIHEVYYHGDTYVIDIYACTEEASSPYGETVEELKENLEMYMEAFDLPVIPYDDI